MQRESRIENRESDALSLWHVDSYRERRTFARAWRQEHRHIQTYLTDLQATGTGLGVWRKTDRLERRGPCLAVKQSRGDDDFLDKREQNGEARSNGSRLEKNVSVVSHERPMRVLHGIANIDDTCMKVKASHNFTSHIKGEGEIIPHLRRAKEKGSCGAAGRQNARLLRRTALDQ